MLSDEEREAVKLLNDMIKNKPDTIRLEWRKGIYALQIILNLIEKQKNIIDSIKRILEDEELYYCDTLDEIYHFYEEVVNNDR